jgi:hypothetical protein
VFNNTFSHTMYFISFHSDWDETRMATLCDNICQWLAKGRWFSPGPPVSSTNKIYHYDIAEILLKVEFQKKTYIMLDNITYYLPF